MQTKDSFGNAKTPLVCFPRTLSWEWLRMSSSKTNKETKEVEHVDPEVPEGQHEVEKANRSCRIKHLRGRDERASPNRKPRTRERTGNTARFLPSLQLRLHLPKPLNSLQLLNLRFEVVLLYGFGLRKEKNV